MKSHSGCFVVKTDSVLISPTLLFASNTVVAATAAAVFTSSCTDADPSHLLSLSLNLTTTKLNCAFCNECILIENATFWFKFDELGSSRVKNSSLFLRSGETLANTDFSSLTI